MIAHLYNSIAIALLMILTVGCAGTSTLRHTRPDGTSLRVTVLEDINAFGVTWHYSVLEECTDSVCRLIGSPQFLGQSGYFASLFGATVQGAAILGAGLAIGEGLQGGVDLNVERGY